MEKKILEKIISCLCVLTMAFCGPICLVYFGLLCASLAGYRVNIGPSGPTGIYTREKKIATTIQQGDLVAFCLESKAAAYAEEHGIVKKRTDPFYAGGCPSDLPPLLAYIKGLPGDQVVVAGDRIEVNGHLVADSKRVETDEYGRPMLAELQSGVIPPGSALVLSDRKRARSFDSRYFGLVSLASLRPVSPVLTF